MLEKETKMYVVRERCSEKKIQLLQQVYIHVNTATTTCVYKNLPGGPHSFFSSGQVAILCLYYIHTNALTLTRTYMVRIRQQKDNRFFVGSRLELGRWFFLEP